jgi:hypothetical protein
MTNIEGHNDQANYRRMSEPFENIEKANESVNKFYKLIETARNECHIMDIHIILKINVIRGNSEGSALLSSHFGNSLESAPMCAWGLGQEQAEYKAAIREFTKGGTE